MEKEKESKLLRAIPKVDEFLGWVEPEKAAPRRVVKETVQEVLEEVRGAILSRRIVAAEQMERQQLLHRFAELMDRKMTPRYRPVINGTGVVVHTNLGRSLLPREAMDGHPPGRQSLWQPGIFPRYRQARQSLQSGGGAALFAHRGRGRPGGQQQCRRRNAGPGDPGRRP